MIFEYEVEENAEVSLKIMRDGGNGLVILTFRGLGQGILSTRPDWATEQNHVHSHKSYLAKIRRPGGFRAVVLNLPNSVTF